MPNQPKTPAHTVRVPNDLWKRAASAAADRDVTISDVIRDLLADYVNTAEGAITADADGVFRVRWCLHPADDRELVDHEVPEGHARWCARKPVERMLRRRRGTST